jgi:hypothetical protein
VQDRLALARCMSIFEGYSVVSGTAIIFSERTAAPGWLRVLAVIVWAGAVALLLVALFDRALISDGVGGTIGGIVGALVLTAVGWASWTAAIVVTITATTVQIGLRPFRAFNIPRMDIASVSAEVVDPSEFGGVGIRFMPPHDWAFLFTAGTGFVLERTTRSTRYHVRSDRAQRILALLREQPATGHARS